MFDGGGKARGAEGGGGSIIPFDASAGSLAGGCAPELVGHAESSVLTSDRQLEQHGPERDTQETIALLTGLNLWPLPGGVWVVLFIPWALLASTVGCQDEDPYRDAPKTPAGYRMEWEALGSDVSWDEVAVRFDAAMVAAAASMRAQYGVEEARFLGLPHEEKIVFHVWDHVQIDGWRGKFQGKRIDVVYWTHSTLVGLPIDAPEDAPVDAPGWTVLPSTKLYPGKWSYGLLHDADLAALLRHELGHAIFGPDFEH